MYGEVLGESYETLDLTISPYARKFLIIRAHHVLDQIELCKTPTAFDSNGPHNKDKFWGRIPTLEKANGQRLLFYC